MDSENSPEPEPQRARPVDEEAQKALPNGNAEIGQENIQPLSAHPDDTTLRDEEVEPIDGQDEPGDQVAPSLQASASPQEVDIEQEANNSGRSLSSSSAAPHRRRIVMTIPAALAQVMDRHRGSAKHCVKCANHGSVVALRGHKNRCPFVNCKCLPCKNTDDFNEAQRKQRLFAKDPLKPKPMFPQMRGNNDAGGGGGCRDYNDREKRHDRDDDGGAAIV